MMLAITRSFLLATTAVIAGCVGGHNVGDLSASGNGSSASTTGNPAETTSGLVESADATTGTSTPSTDSDDADGSTSDELKLDLEVPDVPTIPETCADASDAESTVGCEFFAQDLSDFGLANGWSIIVSNVQQFQSATVTLERRVGGVWVEEDSATVDPLDLHVFDPVDTNQIFTALVTGSAYRITTDVPVVAYQINPAYGGSNSGDASMLYPVSAWDDIYGIVGWDNGTAPGMVYFAVVAAFDDTEVRFEASVQTVASTGGAAVIPALMPGESHQLTMQAGDMLHVYGANADEALTGTVVRSLDEDRPIEVFSGARCVYIPAGIGACDHIETQLSGIQQWGTQHAAARVPVRAVEDPEPSAWHIFARHDNTQLQFHAHADVTGLPPGNQATLNTGEHLELWVAGTPENPGDFFVESSEPVAVVNYMSGADNLPIEYFPDPPGDPAMVQLLPTEQFMPLYVVLVPEGWANDYLVLTREGASGVSIDGALVDDEDFREFAPGFEVARVPVEDGVHLVTADNPFGIEVVGYEGYDSYAYVGGGHTSIINPQG